MKITVLFAIATILFTSAPNCFSQKKEVPIWDIYANAHIGEVRKVMGIVSGFDVIKRKKRILLYCGTGYPNQFFTVIIAHFHPDMLIRDPKSPGKENVVIAKNYAPGSHQKLIGSNISVEGRIKRYRGMPSVEISSWGEISYGMAVDRTPSGI